ncbi:MAG: FISUMP domain-containing protein, partial [Bacteroidales bacterium]|nr:FISUMP domain-containing protein [Bacteroidales bacterium]
MKENLAYLPNVSQPDDGSQTSPFYYVYGYEGFSVPEAKTTPNYQTYGVLYNWPAALTACPQGWHLPSDNEWTILTDYLGGES